MGLDNDTASSGQFFSCQFPFSLLTMQFSTSTGDKNDPIGEGEVAGKYVLLLIYDDREFRRNKNNA